MTTLLNILTVNPANRDQLLEMLQENTDTVIRTLDGWISTTLIASPDGTRVMQAFSSEGSKPNTTATHRNAR